MSTRATFCICVPTHLITPSPFCSVRDVMAQNCTATCVFLSSKHAHLEVALHALAQRVVHHKTHVRLVNAHAKSDGGHDDLEDSTLPVLLNLCSRQARKSARFTYLKCSLMRPIHCSCLRCHWVVVVLGLMTNDCGRKEAGIPEFCYFSVKKRAAKALSVTHRYHDCVNSGPPKATELKSKNTCVHKHKHTYTTHLHALLGRHTSVVVTALHSS